MARKTRGMTLSLKTIRLSVCRRDDVYLYHNGIVCVLVITFEVVSHFPYKLKPGTGTCSQTCPFFCSVFSLTGTLPSKVATVDLSTSGTLCPPYYLIALRT